MIQRALDPEDPASGKWEFPGGHIEPGEGPVEAAKREWCEETGCELPSGKEVSSWKSGIYRGFVWSVEHESDIGINPEVVAVRNPDDPDGDLVEVVAWFDPHQLNRTDIRDEMIESLAAIQKAIVSAEFMALPLFDSVVPS